MPAAAVQVLAGADGVQPVADAGSAALCWGHRQDLPCPKAPVHSHELGGRQSEV